jgi:hypothetical protein
MSLRGWERLCSAKLQESRLSGSSESVTVGCDGSAFGLVHGGWVFDDSMDSLESLEVVMVR